MGLAGMAPEPNTSWTHPQHKVYPYLLRGVPVVRLNQVWRTENITYIRLGQGLAYLVTINGYITMGELLIIALNSTGTDPEKIRVDNEQNAKTGAVPLNCVKSGAA